MQKIFTKVKSRTGIIITTWIVGLVLIIGLLAGVGSISDRAFLWATVASTFLCKCSTSNLAI